MLFQAYANFVLEKVINCSFVSSLIMACQSKDLFEDTAIGEDDLATARVEFFKGQFYETVDALDLTNNIQEHQLLLQDPFESMNSSTIASQPSTSGSTLENSSPTSVVTLSQAQELRKQRPTCQKKSKKLLSKFCHSFS